MRSDGTPIERINPIVKLGAVFVLGISVMIAPQLWLGVGVLAALFIVAAMARQLGPFCILIVSFGVPITAMLLFIQGGYSSDNTTTIAQIGFLTIGLEGVLYALRIVLTVLVFLGSFYLMNRTTPPGKLVAALSSAGMPAKAGYLILASLNVVPQMQRQLQGIQEAQSARGFAIGSGLLSRVRAYIPLMGPAVLSSLTDARERGMTLETRGFGIRGVRRTSYLVIPFTRRDLVISILLALFFAAIVAVTIIVGR